MTENFGMRDSEDSRIDPERVADSAVSLSGILIGVGVILLVSFVGLAAYFLRDSLRSEQDLLAEARRSLLQADAKAVLKATQELLRRDPHSIPALELSAQAYTAQKDYVEAVRFWERIPDTAGATSINAAIESGNLLLIELKQLTAAEKQFRRVIHHDPHHLTANDRLGYILGLSACSWEAIPHRLELIRQRAFKPIHLFLLCMGDSAVENEELLEEYQQVSPEDPRVMIGMSRVAQDRQQAEEAKSYLQEVIGNRPDLIEAHAKLGALLLDENSSKAYLAWEQDLPSEAEAHPGIWAVRGGWAQQQNELPVAIRCFWETIRRDPNHERANYQLSQLLLGAGKTEQAAVFLERAKLLQGYFDAVKIAYTGTDEPTVERAQNLSESLGILWESYGWCDLMLQRDPQSPWALAGKRRLQPRLDGLPLTRAAPGVNPAERVDLSDYPLPATSFSVLPASPVTVNAEPTAEIRFEDLARQAGLDFQYFNSPVPRPEGPKMFEFTGGGAAVLDFDADGWPDLYLTQGCAWPFQSNERTHLDRLYRNRGDGTFEDVTAEAGLFENGFSQGVAVGDINQDGFPDLFVANIGTNRLFQNNGDGTFRDVTFALNSDDDRWSTSCVLADLNGDRWPDLYVANYVSGDDVYDRVCPDDMGISRSCSPRHFPGSQDQLLLNLGNGGFRDVTAESGIVVPDGKGLGIVATDLDGSGRLSLFVANDAVPNFFFANESADSTSPPRFVEQAFSRGLALNEDGRPQACMGIAAGDADGDGMLDLFVTNFHNEFNTLYRQQANGLFADETRAAGLAAPSLKQVAFGTQFVDGELDGRPDLIVVNGDVDDFRDLDRLYAMPPQYFRNLGNGKFRELPGAAVGPYFSRQYLGRGLARLDWDRDGRDDMVVSHLDAPVSLVTNRTPVVGNLLQLRFVGTISERTAIGVTVTLEAGGQIRVKQLTAGDGYQASNERLMTFGLGNSQQVERMTVRWPSGMSQEFTALPVNQCLICIEGLSELLPLVQSQ